MMLIDAEGKEHRLQTLGYYLDDWRIRCVGLMRQVRALIAWHGWARWSKWERGRAQREQQAKLRGERMRNERRAHMLDNALREEWNSRRLGG